MSKNKQNLDEILERINNLHNTLTRKTASFDALKDDIDGNNITTNKKLQVLEDKVSNLLSVIYLLGSDGHYWHHDGEYEACEEPSCLMAKLCLSNDISSNLVSLLSAKFSEQQK